MKFGYAPHKVKAYCRRCTNIFTFSYNYYKPQNRKEQCPFCGEYDEIETNDFIDGHISMMHTGLNLKDEKKRQVVEDELAELDRIKKLICE